MGAKIYDSTSASWKDAETPKIYVGSAFADSKGMSYNGSEWVEDWGEQLVTYAYNRGDECTAVTGGWLTSGQHDYNGSIGYSAYTINKIDFSKYDEVTINCNIARSGPNGENWTTGAD